MDDDPAAPPALALTAESLAAASQFDLSVAESVVLVYDTSLLSARTSSRRQRRAVHPFRAVGTLDGDVDIVVAPGPGAPVAAIAVEFLASMGVKRLVSVGTAGCLVDDHTSLAPFAIVANAISDEGTSRHYSSDLSADHRITEALAEAAVARPCSVTSVTTDVPFRQTAKRLASHREHASLIEMECAAVFAAARDLDVAAGALLVVSDHFSKRGWAKLDAAPIQQGLHAAVAAAAAALARVT